MKVAIAVLAAAMLYIGSASCQSHHEEGVTSSYHAQWTNVAADTKTTTEKTEKPADAPANP